LSYWCYRVWVIVVILFLNWSILVVYSVPHYSVLVMLFTLKFEVAFLILVLLMQFTATEQLIYWVAFLCRQYHYHNHLVLVLIY
jgi:hypothetical protein